MRRCAKGPLDERRLGLRHHRINDQKTPSPFAAELADFRRHSLRRPGSMKTNPRHASGYFDFEG